MSWNDGSYSEMRNEELDIMLFDLYEQYLEVNGKDKEDSTDKDIETFCEIIHDKLTRQVS